MKFWLYIISVACLCGCILANMVSHTALRRSRVEIKKTYQSPQSHLPADVVKMLAGEFKGLVADYLLLEVGSFIGSNREGTLQDYQNVYKALKQSLVLDPYFQQTYIFAQGTLPWEAVMPEKAIELLHISSKHRTWDWFPEQYLGFDYYYFFNDYAKASEVFLEAAQKKNAPLIFSHLGTRFAHRVGRTEAAIALLQNQLSTQELVPHDRREIEIRLSALKGVRMLEQAIDAYHKQHGAYPASLSQLIDSRLLKQMPANPYGEHYIYNAETGSVAFDKVQ